MTERAGEETAQLLFVSNPRAAVDGAPWPEQPVPKGLWEGEPLKFAAKHSSERSKSRRPLKDGADGDKPGPKGFWSKLFAR